MPVYKLRNIIAALLALVLLSSCSAAFAKTPKHTPSPEPTVTVEPTATALPADVVRDQPLPYGVTLLPLSEDKKDLELDLDALPLPKNGLQIPLIYQFDYLNPVCKVNDLPRSVKNAGCGATTAAMMLAYLDPENAETPYMLFRECIRNGKYNGNGLGVLTVAELLSSRGIDVRHEPISESGIRSALRNNHPIIINMGPGIFTRKGHFILLRGLNEEGRVLVNDPNNEARSAYAYEAKSIAYQARPYGMLVIYSKLDASVPEITPTPEPTETPKPGELPLIEDVPKTTQEG